jgi:hypothetical protein
MIKADTKSVYPMDVVSALHKLFLGSLQILDHDEAEKQHYTRRFGGMHRLPRTK